MAFIIEHHPFTEQRMFDALAEANAFQCGYCAPGVTVTLAGALMADDDAGAEAIVTALEGNICRCTGYPSILHGATLAARRMRGEG